MRDSGSGKTEAELQRAHVFVVRDELILVLQQSGGNRWWEFPGGDLEPGEDPNDAAVREVFEESGLRIASPVLLRTWTYHGRHGEQIASYAYAADAPIGDVRLSGEHSAFKWMSVDAYAETYCNERFDVALPQFRDFFVGLRQNCELFRAWIQARP